MFAATHDLNRSDPIQLWLPDSVCQTGTPESGILRYMRNTLYKASLFYFLFFPLVALSTWLAFSNISPTEGASTQLLVTLQKISSLYMYGLPVALVSMLLGKSRSEQPSLQTTSSASKWFRIAAGISATAAVTPFLLSSGVGGFAFLPVYAVVVPVFIVCVIGLIVTDVIRRK